MKAIVTIGISASGKTTWAKQFQQDERSAGRIWLNNNRDDHRWAYMKEAGLAPCWKNWNWKWEKNITEVFNDLLRQAAEAGVNVICSDTNLNKDRRNQLIQQLEGLGYEVETKIFDISFDEAIRRDNAREHGVGYSVIMEQFQRYQNEFGTLAHRDENLPKAAIVDIDGTVADHGGVRGPFDWKLVGMDKPHAHVIAMVEGLAASGYKIIFMSGRDSICRAETEEWIYRYFSENITSDLTLHMRSAGDMRKDTIVKRELFFEHVNGKYDVQICVDDRPCIVRLWNELGLKTLAHGNPYIEF